MLLAANLPCPRGALIDFHLDTGVRTNSLQLGKLLALAAAAPRVERSTPCAWLARPASTPGPSPGNASPRMRQPTGGSWRGGSREGGGRLIVCECLMLGEIAGKPGLESPSL
jgi:hypothetical protein